jgi:putative hemolysin
LHTDPYGSYFFRILASHQASIFVLVCLLVAFYFLRLFNRLKVNVFSLNQEDLQAFRNRSDVQGKNIIRLLDNPNPLLMSFLLVNLLLYTFIFLLSLHLLSFEASGSQIWLWAGITAGLTFFFGEILPAFKPNKRISHLQCRLLGLTLFFFKPLSALLIWLDGLMERFTEKEEKRMMQQEINDILEEPENDDEKEILKGIFNFSHITVRQVMRPRLSITAIGYELGFHQLLNKINKFAFSRLPVYTENLDKIEGILYIKDILPFIDRGEDFRWQRLVRPAYFVPESKKIEDLLKDFQAKRVHIAIVADEYGGTAGLVTLEDILEQILGIAQDEFDEKEIEYKKLNDATFVFEGKINLLDFCRILKVEPDVFEGVRGESESLAGLVLELFGRLPQTGDRVGYEQFSFTVISADIKKVRKVQVSL